MKDDVFHVINIYVEKEGKLKRFDDEYIVKGNEAFKDLRKEMKKRYNTEYVHFTYEKL